MTVIKDLLFPFSSEVIRDGVTQDVLQENTQRVLDAIGADRDPGMERIARLIGGEYIVARIISSGDTAVRHELGRVPTMLVWSAAIDTMEGNAGVVGNPTATGSGGNVAPWDDKFVYLRSKTTGNYAIIIV